MFGLLNKARKRKSKRKINRKERNLKERRNNKKNNQSIMITNPLGQGDDYGY